MSIAEGLSLGLQLSRGAREEVRRDRQLEQQQEQIRRQNAYQDQMQPLQIEATRQGLAAAKAQQEYYDEIRPLNVKQIKQGLAEQEAEQKRIAELHPLQVKAESARGNGYEQSLAQDKIQFEQMQADREREAKLSWVKEQAPTEWNRFATGGQFSDKYLQVAGEVGSPLSPERFLDTKYVNALDTMHNMLDPKHPQSARDKPALMASLNTLFSDQLQSGGVAPNGSAIKSREITELHPVVKNGKPVPGKFYVNLKVTPEQGEPYDAPLTLNRSSDPSDPVKEIDLGDVINMVRSQSYFSQAVKNSPESQQRLRAQLSDMKKVPAGSVEWRGSYRKFSDVLSAYEKDGTLKSPDGQSLVSFADYEWTSGDPAKLEHARNVGQLNQELMAQLTKAQADGDQEDVAKIRAKFVSVQDSWEFAQKRQQDLAADAAAASAKLGGKSPKGKGLQDYQPTNTTQDISIEQARTLTKEQWQERANVLQQQVKQNQQREAEDTKQQRGLALADGQRRLAAHQANSYIDSQFAALPLNAKKEWLAKNEHLLNDDQKFKATNLLNADVYGQR